HLVSNTPKYKPRPATLPHPPVACNCNPFLPEPRRVLHPRRRRHSSSAPMASLAGSALSFARPVKAINIKSVSFSGLRKDNVAFRLQPVPQRFAVCCPAKKETVDQVCDIVKKQLALADDTEVSGSSKFQDLGADSLDTVEIVMGLEEAFGISVEESSAQSIATVEDAANLIDDLVATGAKSS
uniref:Acyl carrier protein n=3 Tax=Setaria TaxID=4554 RepID=K4A1Q9_SETIT